MELFSWAWRGELAVVAVEMAAVGGWTCQMSRTRREKLEDLGVGTREDQACLGLVG